MKKFLSGIKVRIGGFFYDEDRSLDVLVTGKPQETISSEIGRHAATNPVAGAAKDVLDDIQPEHCENAVKHADALDKADNGFEG